MSAMSDVKTPAKIAPAYEGDYFAWSEDQAAKIRAAMPKGVDWENVAEEIESLGRSQKTEIRNRLRVLLVHLLKWEYQPDRRSASWQSTIGEQRISIEGVIEDSPSLRRYPSEVLAAAYLAARERAAFETKMPLNTFPNSPPYSIGEVLNPRFMPGRDWTPAELLDE
jgi:hypothetical protein